MKAEEKERKKKDVERETKQKQNQCSVKDKETYCCANEVRVKMDTFTPKIHQRWGGKLFRHQSGDGFTTPTPYNSNKILHNAATHRILCGETDRFSP